MHELPGGAKWIGQQLLLEVVNEGLRAQSPPIQVEKRHLVVAESMEHRVKEIVEFAKASKTRNERHSFRLKSQVAVQLLSSSHPSSSVEAQQPAQTSPTPFPSLVRRTFVHIPLPSSMRSVSSWHPATA